MEITLKRYFFRGAWFLSYKEDGFETTEDVSKFGEEEINKVILDKFAGILEELVDLRKKEYDSERLIHSLIEKLPESKREELVKDLYGEFITEENS